MNGTSLCLLLQIFNNHNQFSVEPIYKELGQPSCRIQLWIKKREKKKFISLHKNKEKNYAPVCLVSASDFCFFRARLPEQHRWPYRSHRQAFRQPIQTAIAILLSRCFVLDAALLLSLSEVMLLQPPADAFMQWVLDL